MASVGCQQRTTCGARRLKFELISEMMNKKTPEEAKLAVQKRYERMLKNVGEIEGNRSRGIFPLECRADL